jgi:hypothetical protein
MAGAQMYVLDFGTQWTRFQLLGWRNFEVKIRVDKICLLTQRNHVIQLLSLYIWGSANCDYGVEIVYLNI